MSNIEEIKNNISESLETNFIDNMRSVKREMDLLNLLIGSFSNNSFTYDEYCKLRKKFEIEACEEVLGNIEFEKDMSDLEMSKAQHEAIRKSVGSKEDYEDLLYEEIINFQIEHRLESEKEMFYQISKYSSAKLLKEKISDEIWNNKKDYFEDIVETKARHIGEIIAMSHKENLEKVIRSSGI